jgi:hypothetical protein
MAFVRHGRRPVSPPILRLSCFKICGERPSCGWRFAGARVPQIKAATRHSLKDVEAILDAHGLVRDIQVAEAAVLKLEAGTKL